MISGKACLACAKTFPLDLPMCPDRYLSNHSQEHLERVARALPKKTKVKGEYTLAQLLRAIKKAKKEHSMDSKGNIYDVDQEKKTAKNIESGKTIKLTSTKSMDLTALPPEHVEKLKAMNRKDRRLWLAQYKKELSKVRASGVENGN